MSVVSVDEAIGIGAITYYAANCEEMTDLGLTSYYMMITMMGLNQDNYDKQYGFQEGLDNAREMGCADIKANLKSTRMYSFWEL